MQNNLKLINALNTFNKPNIFRVFAYVSICLLLVGLVQIIFYCIKNDLMYLDLITGAVFCIIGGLFLGAISVHVCVQLKSVKYILVPCCVNQSERKIIEDKIRIGIQMVTNQQNQLQNVQNDQVTVQIPVQNSQFQPQIQVNEIIAFEVQVPVM
ncbi:Hypothetical_protein [Hexamita inflata]|uniref:Hypothetical_protein n=1 Tax=Hexamita inflata TaxID=28002 RepID=A0AA86S3N3_9EUKA|nr:Hypothetical protein HINF_LOCUS65095 [Hexamita inflata]